MINWNNATGPGPVLPDNESLRCAAEKKGRALLRDILPDEMWANYEKDGVIHLPGKRGVYVISPDGMTRIQDAASGRCIGRACLQLTTAAPGYDRMVAEYLLLKNAEDYYWKIANTFVGDADIPIMLLALLDFVLFLHLLIMLATALD
jgi:hypothetical protein